MALRVCPARDRELEGLLRTGQLVTQSLRLERVLGEVITQAKSILSEMDIITLYYRDRATGKIKVGGHEGVSYQELLDAEQSEESVVGRVMKLTTPLLAYDVEREPLLKSRFMESSGRLGLCRATHRFRSNYRRDVCQLSPTPQLSGARSQPAQYLCQLRGHCYSSCTAIRVDRETAKAIGCLERSEQGHGI